MVNVNRPRVTIDTVKSEASQLAERITEVKDILQDSKIGALGGRHEGLVDHLSEASGILGLIQVLDNPDDDVARQLDRVYRALVGSARSMQRFKEVPDYAFWLGVVKDVLGTVQEWRFAVLGVAIVPPEVMFRRLP